MLFCVGTGFLVILGFHVLSKAKRTYDKGKALSKGLSLGFWLLDATHCLLVISSSFYNVWRMPINKMVALTVGLVWFGVGVVVMLTGMIEFHSMRMISGLEISEVVTTGIYQWSRNPQYLGWFLVLLGISLVGSSGLALSYTIIAIILFHFYITRMEEPYLEHTFGEKYLSYKTRTPRYVGTPNRTKKINTA